MGVESKRTNKPIAKLRDAAALDLDAAHRLPVDPPNVLAAQEGFDPPNLHPVNGRFGGRFCFSGSDDCRVACA